MQTQPILVVEPIIDIDDIADAAARGVWAAAA